MSKNLWDAVSEETGYNRTDCKMIFYKSIHGLIKLSPKQSEIVEAVERQLYKKGGIAALIKRSAEHGYKKHMVHK